MGCNALRTSHNPPTAELLDACDELGMLVFDETRMMSSNPEGLAQLENMVRRDRNHPSVFMWSMANEESTAATETEGADPDVDETGCARRHDGSRPISLAPAAGGSMGRGGLVVCDVMGYNYADPAAEAFHKANPEDARDGHGAGERRRDARHLRDGRGNAATSVRTTCTPPRGALRRRAGGASATPGPGWREASSGRGSTTAASPRPTSGRTSARSSASSTPAASPRISSSTTSPGGRRSRCCTCSRIGTGRAWRAGDRCLGVLESGQGGAVPQRPEPWGEGDEEGLAPGVERQYSPGTIEARGFKDGRQVMTAKRETTGAGGQAGHGGGPPGDLRRRRGRRDVRGGSPGRPRPRRAAGGERSDVSRFRPGETDRRRQRRARPATNPTRAPRERPSPAFAWPSCRLRKQPGTSRWRRPHPGSRRPGSRLRRQP